MRMNVRMLRKISVEIMQTVKTLWEASTANAQMVLVHHQIKKTSPQIHLKNVKISMSVCLKRMSVVHTLTVKILFHIISALVRMDSSLQLETGHSAIVTQLTVKTYVRLRKQSAEMDYATVEPAAMNVCAIMVLLTMATKRLCALH